MPVTLLRTTAAARRPLLDEGREALPHLVGGEGLGEHREVDRRQLPVEVALERAAGGRRRLAHALDRFGHGGIQLVVRNDARNEPHGERFYGRRRLRREEQ